MFSYQKINAFLIVNLIFIEKVSEYEILFIYVKKTYRRKGLANYLLNNNYIQKNKSNLKKIFLEVAENNMKTKKIFVKSYGCQMNVYDSNRIKDLFFEDGYVITNDIKDANLIVLNTCHIREKAAEKVYSDIGRIKKIKKKKLNDDCKLVVAGCVAQAEGVEIKKRAPSVDFVVGPQAYHKLPNMIKNDDISINDDFLQNEKFNHLIYDSSNNVSEFVSIQEGCN